MIEIRCQKCGRVVAHVTENFAQIMGREPRGVCMDCVQAVSMELSEIDHKFVAAIDRLAGDRHIPDIDGPDFNP